MSLSWQTQSLHDAVLQTSRHEREEAEQKLIKMSADNADLVQRLVEMKATEMERMMEVNRTCDEMVSSYKYWTSPYSCLWLLVRRALLCSCICSLLGCCMQESYPDCL